MVVVWLINNLLLLCNILAVFNGFKAQTTTTTSTKVDIKFHEIKKKNYVASKSNTVISGQEKYLILMYKMHLLE